MIVPPQDKKQLDEVQKWENAYNKVLPKTKHKNARPLNRIAPRKW